MQRIWIVCMGKLNQAFYAQGVAEYAKRLSALCKFEVIELAEEPLADKNASDAQVAAVLEKEAKRILAAIPKGARIIPLCVEGKQLTSEGFAGLLEQGAVNGSGDTAFVIGSSHGLSGTVKSKAAYKLSLSQMTLPHQLARLVLAEQVYRAFMIRQGARYHK